MVLVGRYSGCLLTRESDRLIAFSAIAREFATIMQDTYIAGLWKRNFVSQLDWAIPSYSRMAARPEVYTAPSWSWPSVGTIAQWPARFDPKEDEVQETMELIDVVDVSVTPEYDEFGAVREGHLIVRGLLKKLDRVAITANSSLMVNQEGVPDGPTFLQLRQPSEILEAPEPIAAEIANSEPVFSSGVDFDIRELPPASEIDYLPTLVLKQPGESRVVGMVLEHVAGSIKTFKRIGRFDFKVDFYNKYSSESSEFDPEEAVEDAEDEEMSEDLEFEDPNEKLHLFWEWDMLSRAFLGNERPLFEFNASTQEYERIRFDKESEFVII